MYGMVHNISPLIEEKWIGEVYAYDMKSHGYYIFKFLSFSYKIHMRKIVDVQLLNKPE